MARFPLIVSESITETKSKDVVVAVVACRATHSQVEDLSEIHGWGVIHGERSTDKRDDSIIQSGLDVTGADLVFDLRQACKLFHDSLCA